MEGRGGEGRGGERRGGSQLVRAHAAEQREGVLKLLDKDVFNWAVDNSVFSRFTGRHSDAFEECGEERKKRRMGRGNL